MFTSAELLENTENQYKASFAMVGSEVYSTVIAGSQ